MPFHSLKNLPRRNLAFLALLGDTIYADVESPALPGVAQADTIVGGAPATLFNPGRVHRDDRATQMAGDEQSITIRRH